VISLGRPGPKLGRRDQAVRVTKAGDRPVEVALRDLAREARRERRPARGLALERLPVTSQQPAQDKVCDRIGALLERERGL
jgi:hypothetical protein